MGKPHWRAGTYPLETGRYGGRLVWVMDPNNKGTTECFRELWAASDWLIEQLHERSVADLGGIEEALATTRYVQQMTKYFGAEPMPDVGWLWEPVTVREEDLYGFTVCACDGDVSGICHSRGCERDVACDAPEPDSPYPAYLGYSSTCLRCTFAHTSANGGPYKEWTTPRHLHHGHTAGHLAPIIDGDEHVGWHCTEIVDDSRTGSDYDLCEFTHRFR
jgi:hypothetical protein